MRHAGTTLLLTIALAASVAAAPAITPPTADAGNRSTTPDECTTTYGSDFNAGDHWDWTITAVPDGPRWAARQEPLARGVMLLADASGSDGASTRLAAPAVVAGPTSQVRFQHDRTLAPGDGLVLEASTDGGTTWSDAGDLLAAGGYDGTVEHDGDSRPAWTGSRPAPVGGSAGRAESVVDLSSLEGEQVVLSWRLLQNASPAPAPGTYAALIDVEWSRVVDGDCLDGYATNPWARCLGDQALPVSTDTARNDDGTPTWQEVPSFQSTYATTATGLQRKDDRLVTETFSVNPRTRVSLLHRWLLEPGRDGGTLEYRTNEGSWTPVPAEWFVAGPYEGVRADGAPAWTDSSATHSSWWPTAPAPEWFLASAVHLGELAGEQVQVRLRLLQDELRPGSVPGGEWAVFGAIEAHDTELEHCPGLPPPGDDGPEACSPLDPPAALSLPTDDRDTTLPLRIRVLLDVAEATEIVELRDDPAEGTDEQAAALLAEVVEELAPAFEAARPGYEDLGIEIEYSFDVLSVRDGGEPSTPEELIADAKVQYDGVRPEDVDVVYIATDNRPGGLTGGPAGQADCVGGVQSDGSAFAAGDIYRDQEDSSLNGGLGAFTLAHEVGHLLGAHHHFANCVESLPSYGSEGDLTDVCTVMINDNSLGQHQFSTVNAAIVRGHAEEFTGG